MGIKAPKVASVERVPQDPPTHFACTAWLNFEAELLDDNRLREWLELLDPAIDYRIPIRVTRERAAGPGFSDNGWHMRENHSSIETRVERLETEYAWAEDPPSRARRFVSNVRVTGALGDGELHVKSNLLLFRSRYDSAVHQLLSGERRDVLREVDNELKLQSRLVLLDHSTLGTPNLGLFLLTPDLGSDRDRVDAVIDDMAQTVDQGLIPASIFNDPEVHRRELESIFPRAWVYLGHETEVPARGDYVLRYIGQDPFILVRDEHGKIRVLFDGCRHRGALVCRAEKGNASHFRCSYHGWTYKNTGELVGAPSFREAYGGLKKSDWGLMPAAQVGSVHGFVFATLAVDAPPLEQYLGDMKWYMDVMWGLSDEGLEVVGEPQRWIMDSNWKSAADNFSGDDYHTLFLHKSMFEVGAVQIPPRLNMFGYHVQVGNGHTMSFSIAPEVDDPGPKFWGYPDEVVATFNPSRVTPEQFELARRARVSVGTIFPNLSFLMVPLTAEPKTAPPTGMLTVRQWQPKGPGQMEVWVWFLVWKGISDELKEASYRAAMGTFSSSGIFEQDDSDPWQSIARTGGTVFARQSGMKLNYQMGLPGFGIAEASSDFPGPGIAVAPRYEEGVQRSFYRRWLSYMTDEGYPPPLVPQSEYPENGRPA